MNYVFLSLAQKNASRIKRQSMEGLYKLPKDMLVKIIESGFSVNNLKLEEAVKLEKECKKHICKLRTDKIKKILKHKTQEREEKEGGKEEENFERLINQITKVFDCDDHLVIYSKKNFELGFDISMCWGMSGLWRQPGYICVFDITRTKKFSPWVRLSSEDVKKDERYANLDRFHSFIIDALTIEDVEF